MQLPLDIHPKHTTSLTLPVNTIIKIYCKQILHQYKTILHHFPQSAESSWIFQIPTAHALNAAHSDTPTPTPPPPSPCMPRAPLVHSPPAHDTSPTTPESMAQVTLPPTPWRLIKGWVAHTKRCTKQEHTTLLLRAGGGISELDNYPAPLAQARQRSQKTRQNSGSTPIPVLSHNPTMPVTPGIPPAGNQCSRVQHMRRSRGQRSFIRGEAALMSPARRQSPPLLCAHIPCVAPTSLLDRVLPPLRLKKKCTRRKSCVMPVGAMIYTPGINLALSGTRPPCTFSILCYQCG